VGAGVAFGVIRPAGAAETGFGVAVRGAVEAERVECRPADVESAEIRQCA